MQNERHVACEHSPKTQKERHAAWDGMLVKESTVKRPKWSPLKIIKNIVKKQLFWIFHGASLERADMGAKKWSGPS